MSEFIINMSDAVARNPQVRLSEPVNFQFGKEDHIALVGANGAGKSLLVDMITGKNPLSPGGVLEYDFSPSPSNLAYENIRQIAFKDTYGAADANYYYQQRWNSQDQEEVPTVADALQGMNLEDPFISQMIDVFALSSVMQKKLIHLSSGELRKFQLLKTLVMRPRVLIVDNPFIGLDVEARNQLIQLFTMLSHNSFVRIILVLSMLDDIPEFITHVIRVENRSCSAKIPRSQYLSELDLSQGGYLDKESELKIKSLPGSSFPEGQEIVSLKDVNIRYGERTILKNLDWNVYSGQKWALSGENGAGKSTLLSLVCADNPQSYACNISLFGGKRGTGESIWDIKKHIGYVSPEMHRAYHENIPAIEIVASGLRDSVGLYCRPRPQEMGVCEFWMDIFGILDLRDRLFLQLSSGEQRMVLLARAFVKDPRLLILDEPLHGLDTYNRRRVRDIIQAFCARPDKTLIMVTHYKQELPECINQSLFLKKNR